MTTETLALTDFFEQPELDAEQYRQFADAVHASFHSYERFDTLTREREQQGGDALRIGLALLILNRFEAALEKLAQAPAGKLRDYCAAEAAEGLNRYDEAEKYLKQAASAGWDAFEVDMQIAALKLRQGDQDAAEKLLAKHESGGQDRAEWYYVQGLQREEQGAREAALESYDRALTLNPDHAPTMFRAARLHDLCGDDEQAIELYDRLAAAPRAHVNALMNAAVVYEDVERFDDAAHCLRRVLRLFPNHTRARLFLKDVESCLDMVIDEVGEKRVDARSRLLDTPLSEFELSVRARNCLKKMKIDSLGELIRLTEAELLAYKNFGETSLNEIKALLVKKNLQLGMNPDEVEAAAAAEEPVEYEPEAPRVSVPAGQEAMLGRPVSELELSVRARRCLQRLNVQTLGDLIQYSESDLLSTRNFGVTSLNEIKARLSENGLHLAPKRTS